MQTWSITRSRSFLTSASVIVFAVLTTALYAQELSSAVADLDLANAEIIPAQIASLKRGVGLDSDKRYLVTGDLNDCVLAHLLLAFLRCR